MRHEAWYRLDNVAKIYPVLARSRHLTMFRLSATLTIPVDPALLQQAFDQTLERLPFFAVRLRRGLFWYYFEANPHPARIEEDVRQPLRPLLPGEHDGYLLSVRYTDRRIAVDFFHALTDGTGGTVFMKTLVACYLNLAGHPVKPDPAHGILDCHTPFEPTEMEDAYKRHARFHKAHRPSLSRAFQLQGTLKPGHHFQIISGTMPVEALSRAAKAHRVSVTELLVGVAMFQIYRLQQKGGFKIDAPVRISVPINMRRFFPSQTLRNFFLYALPGIEPAYGDYTFDEILQAVHHFMRYTVNEKYLNAMMAANVMPENNWLIRISPLILKNAILRLVYAATGEASFSATFSNLGVQNLPPDLARWIDHLDFLLGPSRCTPVNGAVVSCNGQVVVNLTSTIAETDFQREFFRHLVRLGVPVRIASNLN